MNEMKIDSEKVLNQALLAFFASSVLHYKNILKTDDIDAKTPTVDELKAAYESDPILRFQTTALIIGTKDVYDKYLKRSEL